MSSVEADGAPKRDFNDSGCIQDESPVKMEAAVKTSVDLLDLSDDVLLCIFKYCSPRDLKALGYTCARLGTLTHDRTLWRRVSEYAQPTGELRLRWYLRRFTEHTEAFHCCGYAWDHHRCQDFTNRYNKMTDKDFGRIDVSDQYTDKAKDEDRDEECDGPTPTKVTPSDQERTLAFLAEGPLEECAEENCPGPLNTVTAALLRRLRVTCPALTSLSLDYCNIDCSVTQIVQFPRTLRYLSLRGTKCYNIPVDKSFMFRVHDHLKELEELDVSCCEWMEGCVLLPLSKLPAARRLLAQNCRRLTECVAYASLAARYGFLKLQALDVRGSPLADSEVSSLGWLPSLEELYLSAAPAPQRARDRRPRYAPGLSELEPWEIDEPDYLKKPSNEPESSDEDDSYPALPPLPPNITNVLTISFNRNADTNEFENFITRHRIEGNQIRPVDSFDEPSTSKPTTNKKATIQDLAEKIRKRENAGLIMKRRRPKTGDDDASEDEIEHLVLPKGNTSDELEIQKIVVPPRDARLEDDNVHRLNICISSTLFDDQKPKAEKPPEPKKVPEKVPEKAESPEKRKRSLDSDSSDDDMPPIPIKRVCERTGLNVGASTSKDEETAKDQKYVRFCRNKNPVLVGEEEAGPSGLNTPKPEAKTPNADDLYQSVLYLYRVPVQNHPRPYFHPVRRDLHQMCRHLRLPTDTPLCPHIDANSLVSDSTIRRFGYSDEVDANYIQINGNANCERPNKSKLKILVATGYSYITNKSLEHLATAAPNLTYVDFSETKVNSKGVVSFRTLRPDCEVRYGEKRPAPKAS